MVPIGWFEAEFPRGEILSRWNCLSNGAVEGSCVPLCAKDKLTIGRLDERPGSCCDWVFEEPTISAIHLRIYTITYDEHGGETLVFAEDLSSNGTYRNGRYLGRGQPAVALLDGDVLKLCDAVTLRWKQTEVSPQQLSQTQQREIKFFASSYHVSDKLLGTGANGKVLVASHAFTKRQMACKVVDIAGHMKSTRGELEKALKPGYKHHGSIEKAVCAAVAKKCKEVQILRNLCHPNIVAVEKIFQSTKTIYIIQELLVGGDLYSYCLDESLSEGIAAVIIRQVLEAVDYLHQRNIVHRDIKPENVLLASRSTLPRVVLIDFGEAKLLCASKRTNTLAGTYEYMAPEVWRQPSSYTKAVDMWSVGVLAFVIVVGELPFGSEEEGCWRASLDTVQDERETPSPRLRDFIHRLLVENAAERMSVKESLAHHWFQNSCNREVFDGAYQRAIRGWSATGEVGHVEIAEEGAEEGVNQGRGRFVTL